MREDGIVDRANQLILYVSRTIPFRSGLDRHLVRAAMVFTFFVFSIQKWNQYTIEMLVPMISHSPVVFWLINCCEVEDRLIGVVRNFCKYQHPEKPRFVWDLPDEWKRYAGHKMPVAAVADQSPTSRRHVDDTSLAPRERVDRAVEGDGDGTLNVPNLDTSVALRDIDTATLLAELKARNLIVPRDSDGLGALSVQGCDTGIGYGSRIFATYPLVRRHHRSLSKTFPPNSKPSL
jgi:hypothetical protein